VALEKRIMLYIVLIFILSLFFSGCSKDNHKTTAPPNYDHSQDDPYDIDTYGIPKFVNVNYIELEKIHRISRFRSSEGHDYSDDFESC
jgi:hypothetical protein